jgi:hypothetical protein
VFNPEITPSTLNDVPVPAAAAEVVELMAMLREGSYSMIGTWGLDREALHQPLCVQAGDTCRRTGTGSAGRWSRRCAARSLSYTG